MQSKVNRIFLLLAAVLLVFSCTKHGDANPPVVPALLDTLDAGWQQVKLNDSLNLEDIFFVNTQTGFICGNNYIGKSIDGGITWKKCIPDSLNDSFVNLFFTDASNGWAFGGQNFSLRTTDGGTSWRKIVRGMIYDGQFFDANNGYIVVNGFGSALGLYKTTDGGITASLVKSQSAVQPYALFFLNQNKGWFSTDRLNRTEDAGTSFSLSVPIAHGEYAIQFTDEQHGWIAGFSGVYKTADGGTTLENVLPSTGPDGSDIQFFDNNTGYILNQGAIYLTVDNGKTLKRLGIIHKSITFEIHFTDPGHGWTAGHGGYVYRYIKP